MMQDGPAALKPGDRLPFCYGMDEAGSYYSFEAQAGRPAVLILAGEGEREGVAVLAKAFSDAAAAFAARNSDVRLMTPVGYQSWAASRPPAGIGLVHCMDNALFDAAVGSRVIVADRALALAVRLDDADPVVLVERALRALEDLPVDTAPQSRCPAPVLVRPGLLDADLCRRLIERFEAGGHVQGAMASVDAQGLGINRIDADKKHRRDLELDPAEPLHIEVLDALSTRLVPDIAKVFQAQVAHVDRVLIARYDDAGGYFRRHRDNSATHLAYREFALSVNLNAGGYEGGWLLFPEFNDQRHLPPTGAGFVFSASLLHEAAAVTRGRRYVLLTFLHGESAERRRLALAA